MTTTRNVCAQCGEPTGRGVFVCPACVHGANAAGTRAAHQLLDIAKRGVQEIAPEATRRRMIRMLIEQGGLPLFLDDVAAVVDRMVDAALLKVPSSQPQLDLLYRLHAEVRDTAKDMRLNGQFEGVRA